MDNSIDVVIAWVDGSDPNWREVKNAHDPYFKGDSRDIRFRDWDNLQYVFRGIEKFMPWVRKVHFVTWGHLPKWLNTGCKKLNIVNHTDYIPKIYLPTFSSHPIEMNFHRIKGLAEQFIYANDDMFFLKEMEPDMFFKEGLPCDSLVETALQFHKGGIDHIIGNNLEIINEHFEKRDCRRNHSRKWFSRCYGKQLFRNLYMYPFKDFTGFMDHHLPISLKKSTYIKVWEMESEKLNSTCLHKIRSVEDVNCWLFRYWQLVSGSFYPRTTNIGRFFSIGRDDIEIERAIKNQTVKMVCLSDDNENMDFEKEKDFIKDCFQTILPEKSSFEKMET